MATATTTARSAAQDSNPRYASIAETAHYLRVGRTTLYRLAAQPGFPRAHKVGARVRRFNLCEVDAYMAGGSND